LRPTGSVQQMADLSDEFLTVAEVAATLKLNQQTVRNWIDQGKLPALRVGRRVRITRADFESLISQGYDTAAKRSSTDQEITAQESWDGAEHPLPLLPPR
jgi:excisionase family DNA binding protein